MDSFKQSSPQEPLLTVDRDTVRWYILRLPERHQGRALALEKAKCMCVRDGDVTFDYLAPTFKEKRWRNGREVLVDISTLYNYVFVRSSVATIFQLKRTVLPAYNFLKRYRYKDRLYFPYVSDDTMETLRWVASSYHNVVPCYIPGVTQLSRGDVIRFTSGSLSGKTAEIVTLPGTRRKEFVVRVRIESGVGRDDDNELFSIPIHIGLDECSYVVERLNVDDKQLYARLDNTRLLSWLFDAVVRQRQTLLPDKDAMSRAADVVQQYASVSNVTTHILRSKLFSYLLPAYLLLGRKAEYDALLREATAFVDVMSARQARIQLCITLLACTGEYCWCTLARELMSHSSGARRMEQYHAWLGMLETAYEPVFLRQRQLEHVRSHFPSLLRSELDALCAMAGVVGDNPHVSQVHAALHGLLTSHASLLSPAGIDSSLCSRLCVHDAVSRQQCDAPSLPADDALESALADRDVERILSLRPHLQDGTYVLAVNNASRVLARHLAWAVLRIDGDTLSHHCLRALVYIDVMRTT